jgi:hypothetical protein
MPPDYEPQNIGGLNSVITAHGLKEKIDLVNKAIGLYQEADRLIERASQICVDVSF